VPDLGTAPPAAGFYPSFQVDGRSATPGASIDPRPAPSPSAPIVPTQAAKIAPGAQAIIDKLRKENAELKARIQAMAKGGATSSQLAQRDQLIAKLRGDVATLTKTIQTASQPPAPGTPGTGLQQLVQGLIKRAQAAEAAARSGSGNPQELAQLRTQVQALTATIQTAGQPPAPGRQPTGLQQLVQGLVRKVQTREAALRAHGIPVPTP
jgi:hypothetical protein